MCTDIGMHTYMDIAKFGKFYYTVHVASVWLHGVYQMMDCLLLHWYAINLLVCFICVIVVLLLILVHGFICALTG